MTIQWPDSKRFASALAIEEESLAITAECRTGALTAGNRVTYEIENHTRWSQSAKKIKPAPITSATEPRAGSDRGSAGSETREGKVFSGSPST